MQCNFQSALIFLCRFVHREMSRWLVRDGKERTFPQENMFSPPSQDVDVTITLSHDLMGHHWVIQDQVFGSDNTNSGKIIALSLIFNYSHKKFESSGFNLHLAGGNFWW